MKKSLLIIILIAANLYVTATTFYISNSGNDNNSGKTRKKAWKTINRINLYAADAGFMGGDSIQFEGGSEYLGSLILKGNIPQKGKNTGTFQKPIVICNYNSGHVIINSSSKGGICIIDAGGFKISNLQLKGNGGKHTMLDGENTASGISFENNKTDSSILDYVFLENLEVSGYQLIGINISVNSNSSIYQNVSVLNCKVFDNGESGIYTSGRIGAIKNLYVSHCSAYRNSGIKGRTDNTGNGIEICGIDKGVIEYNQAYENGIIATGGPVGIWIFNSNNVVMQHNESHHNHTTTAWDGAGFDIDGGSTNSILQYNYSHDNDGAGFLSGQYEGAPEMKNNIIRFNLSQNDGRKNGYGGIAIFGVNPFSKLDVHNNMVYVSAKNVVSGIPAALYLMDNNYSGVNIWNNVFIVADSAKILFAGQSQAPDTSTAWLAGNCFYSENGYYGIQWGPNKYSNFHEWKKDFPTQETFNNKNTELVTNPLIQNPGKAATLYNPAMIQKLSEYKIMPNSPLRGKGVKLPASRTVNLQPALFDFYGNTIEDDSFIGIEFYSTKN